MPTFTGISWVDWTVYFAAFVAASGLLWKQFFEPVLRAIEKVGAIPERLVVVEDAVSVLNDVVTEVKKLARQLEPNGGSSMHDRLTKVEASQRELVEELRPMVKTIAALAGPKRRTTTRTRKGD